LIEVQTLDPQVSGLLWIETARIRRGVEADIL